MSRVLKDALAGAQLGESLGQGYADYAQQQQRQDFEREQRAQQLKDQVSLMAAQNPDFAQALQDILPGQTIDGQKSVKPLAMTPEQQQAIASGQDIPEAPTMEIGGRAFNPAAYKAALLDTEQRKADQQLRLHAKMAKQDYNQGVYDANSGLMFKNDEKGNLAAYKIPIKGIYGQAAEAVDQEPQQPPAFTPEQPVEPQSYPQGGFVPSGASEPLGQIPRDEVPLPAQRPDFTASNQPQTTTGLLAQKLEAQNARQTAIEKMRQDSQERSFANQNALLDKRLSAVQETVKGKNEQAAEQKNVKRFDDLLKQANPLQATRGPLKIIADSDNRANRALVTLQKPSLTNQEASNIMTDIAGIYKGGSPTESEEANNNYSTLYSKIANMAQYITGNPKDAVPEPIRQKLLETVADMKRTNAAVFTQNFEALEAGHPGLVAAHQEEWDSLRKKFGTGLASGIAKTEETVKAPEGKIIITAPDGQQGYWPKNKPIPSGYK